MVQKSVSGKPMPVLPGLCTLRGMRYNRLDLNLLPAPRALLTEKSMPRAAETLHVPVS